MRRPWIKVFHLGDRIRQSEQLKEKNLSTKITNFLAHQTSHLHSADTALVKLLYLHHHPEVRVRSLCVVCEKEEAHCSEAKTTSHAKLKLV